MIDIITMQYVDIGLIFNSNLESISRFIVSFCLILLGRYSSIYDNWNESGISKGLIFRAVCDLMGLLCPSFPSLPCPRYFNKLPIVSKYAGVYGHSTKELHTR